MNRFGAAGLGGYDPKAVVAYLDSRKGTMVTAVGQTRATLNGRRLMPSDARTIRRWRNQAHAVSLKGLLRVLDLYGLELEHFKRWAKRHGYGNQPRI